MKNAFYLVNRTTGYRITSRIRTVGRTAECDIVLDHDSVSRVHARIYRQGDQVVVEDLDSLNGVFINDVLIEGQGTLKSDDYVSFAQCKFRLVPRERIPSDRSTAELGHNTTLYRMLQLSKSQKRVLKLLLRGKSEKEAGVALGISQHTVHCHVRAIYQIFDVTSRAELMAHFIDRQNSEEFNLPGKTSQE